MNPTSRPKRLDIEPTHPGGGQGYYTPPPSKYQHGGGNFMDRRPTSEEWTELLHPFLTQFHKRSARKKLCQLHQNSPVKESKVQCPCATGETCFATITARELKIWVVSPDGGSAYMEYDANGRQIDGSRQLSTPI